MQVPQHPAPLVLLDAAGVQAKGIPGSPKYWQKLEDKGEFPKRIYLGRKFPRWDEADVDAYIAKLAARRDEDRQRWAEAGRKSHAVKQAKRAALIGVSE